MDSLRKNKTWELVDHPARQKLMSCKWIFKIKDGIKGVQKPRYKVRSVAHRFIQRAEQLDVKMTFLHGNLEEVNYMRQLPGYVQGVRHEGTQRSKVDSWYGDHQGSKSQDSEGVTIQSLARFFYGHVDSYTQRDLDYAAGGNLKGLIRNEVVRVKIPKFMSWLDAYDVPIGDLDMMEDKVDN
ncbi:retrovirus-related pol polyprotein from transposon TNT 1-94 [Tanacetum coccineum]